MDYLLYKQYCTELRHHGIKGQKYGVKNGPPYPLSYEDHSAKEKKSNSKTLLGAIKTAKRNKENDAAVYETKKRNLETNYQIRMTKAKTNAEKDKAEIDYMKKSNDLLNEYNAQKQSTEKANRKNFSSASLAGGVALAVGLFTLGKMANVMAKNEKNGYSDKTKSALKIAGNVLIGSSAFAGLTTSGIKIAQDIYRKSEK